MKLNEYRQNEDKKDQEQPINMKQIKDPKILQFPEEPFDKIQVVINSKYG